MLETLAGLGVPRASLDNMITVGNKMDLVPPGEWPRLKEEWGLLPISAKEGFGLGLLARTIETKILTLTGRQQLKVTVPVQARAAKLTFCFAFQVRCLTGSPDDDWVSKNVTVTSRVIDPSDENFSVLSVVVSEAERGRIRKKFFA